MLGLYREGIEAEVMSFFGGGLVARFSSHASFGYSKPTLGAAPEQDIAAGSSPLAVFG